MCKVWPASCRRFSCCRARCSTSSARTCGTRAHSGPVPVGPAALPDAWPERAVADHARRRCHEALRDVRPGRHVTTSRRCDFFALAELRLWATAEQPGGPPAGPPGYPDDVPPIRLDRHARGLFRDRAGPSEQSRWKADAAQSPVRASPSRAQRRPGVRLCAPRCAGSHPGKTGRPDAVHLAQCLTDPAGR